jgi:mannose-1-phosphate guanylyltransferase
MIEGMKRMFAVIMAGGRGTRFWPRSREKMPKHLLDINGEKSLIRETVDRIAPLVSPERTLIVTGRSHAVELIRLLPEIPPENILIEPVGRNTAPCIGLAALIIQKRVGDAVMLVLPSDHRIEDEIEFRRVLQTAAARATSGKTLLTIGIKPTGPETGYGYLEEGEIVGTDGKLAVYRVRSIREKPDPATAGRFLKKGGFLWNSGMFVWKASTILGEISRFLPDLYAGLIEIENALGRNSEDAVLERIYPSLRSVSIDYGVMEKAKDVLVIPGDFGWSDLGSWDSLWEVSRKDESRNVVRGRLIGVNASGLLVYSPKKLVSVVDVQDILVVETDDALLICRRGSSQEVRRIVEKIEQEGLKEYL